MAIYYPDGDGGRRILDGGSTTTIINNTVQGALVFKGVISTETLLPNVQSKKGAAGDLWSLGFTNEEKNIYKGDLLIYDGENWELLGTSPQRPFYTLPTANESVKGGVKIGDGLTMVNDTLNVDLEIPEGYTLPAASDTIRGGIRPGKGLYMEGDVLNVSGANDSEEDKKSINIKNIIKGSGSGGSGETVYGDWLLGTIPLSVEGGMWLQV